jgi:hypothetical protein
MLFTGINRTKNEEGMYTYTCICSRIKLLNEKQKKKQNKTGEKIRSAGL